MSDEAARCECTTILHWRAFVAMLMLLAVACKRVACCGSVQRFVGSCTMCTNCIALQSDTSDGMHASRMHLYSDQVYDASTASSLTKTCDTAPSKGMIACSMCPL